MIRLASAALLVASLSLTACSTGVSGGSRAPGFSAMDTQGNTIALADYQGKSLILDFWAVW